MVKLAVPMVLVVAAGVRASDVYQNNTSRVGTVNALLAAGQANSLERGNQINLGGTDRVASRLYWMMRIGENSVATFDAELRFYANDGPGGQPGTLLWDSGVGHYLIDSGGDMTFVTSLPPVSLPNTFTWTV